MLVGLGFLLASSRFLVERCADDDVDCKDCDAVASNPSRSKRGARRRHPILSLAIAAVLSGTALADDSSPVRLHPEASLRFRSELDVVADAAEPDRYRFRLRGRLGATYDVGPGLDIGGRLTTGSEDPTSSQLTLGHELDKQPLKLDRAFVRFRRDKWLELMVGKLPPVFRNRRLIWDPDVSPEGLSQALTFGDPNASLAGHLTVGEFILAEVDQARDAFMLVGQIGIALRRGPVEASLDLAVHDYPNVTRVVLDQSHGSNTVDAAGHLSNEFRLADALFEFSIRIPRGQLGGYAELSRNVRATPDAHALAVGLEFAANCPGLRLGYEFRRVERDAILDALAESAWYTERTAFQGHRVSAKLRLPSGWTLASSARSMRAIGEPAHRQLVWLVDAEWTL